MEAGICGAPLALHLCGSPDPKIGVSQRPDTAEAQKLRPDTKRGNTKEKKGIPSFHSCNLQIFPLQNNMDSDKLLKINQTTFGGYVRANIEGVS